MVFKRGMREVAKTGRTIDVPCNGDERSLRRAAKGLVRKRLLERDDFQLPGERRRRVAYRVPQITDPTEDSVAAVGHFDAPAAAVADNTASDTQAVVAASSTALALAPVLREHVFIRDATAANATVPEHGGESAAGSSSPPARLSPSELGPKATLPLLLSADEVAELLRTTREAIYARVARGELPGVIRDGRRLLFEREALLHWLAERRASSPGSSLR